MTESSEEQPFVIETNVSEKADRPNVVGIGLVYIAACFAVSALLWMSILLILLKSNFGVYIGAAVVGILQLAAAISLAVAGRQMLKRAQWVKTALIVAVGFFVVEVAVLVAWVWMIFLPEQRLQGQSSLKSRADLMAKDPDSRTVVTIEQVDALFGGTRWSGTISADGIHPTQYTGCPVELIGWEAIPKSMVWHNNPDWVEITMSDGAQLKLEWDDRLLNESLNSAGELHYIAPQFTRMR